MADDNSAASNNPESAPARPQRGLRRVLRGVLGTLGLAVLGWMAWSVRSDLAGLQDRIEGSTALLAVVLGVAVSVVQGIMFSALLSKHGMPVDRIAHLRAYLWSLPWKYVPGRFWGPMLQAASIPVPGAVQATLLANLELMGVTALLLMVIGVANLPEAPLWLRCVAALTGWALIAALLRQDYMARLVGLLKRRIRRFSTWMTDVPHRSPPWTESFAIAGVSLVVTYLASATLVAATGQVSAADVGTVVSVICLGWLVGLIAIVVPAGIGVREASSLAAATLIAPALPRDAIITVMIVARVWQLVVDVLSLVLATLLRARS